MPTTIRVLSGSKTRGSTATLTGSAEYYYQGINSKTFSAYFSTLIPRVGSGDRTHLVIDGKPISEVTFDDSIVVNNTIDDMGGENDLRIKQEISFDFESRNLGQPPTTLLGEPFADALDYDAKLFLIEPEEVMWPVNLWNLGDLPKYEFDGVIEPLDIRREILGQMNLRFEGRTIRGALVGAASERPWGSIEIRHTWEKRDQKTPSFLDSPDAMFLKHTTLTVQGEKFGTGDVFSVQPFQEINPASETGIVEEKYHETVYKQLRSHNDQDLVSALVKLNSSSCDSITSPLQKRASTGFYFGEQAGSIIFGDTFVVGEY